MRTAVVFDPFVRGPLPVAERTVEAHDSARNRLFPCEIWTPVADGLHPLVIFSHASRQHRRSASFLCSHLASYGYFVCAMDHSEVVAPEMAGPEGETAEQKSARFDAVIGSRVPDACFLLDRVLDVEPFPIDAGCVGIVGHSFGGWTALESAGADPRFRAVVALAPAGASNPKPGILPAVLNYRWRAPMLLLAAEDDAMLPLAGMNEIFDRTLAPKLMVTLRRSDHLHFLDHFAELHENFRTMPMPEPLASLQRGMRPMAELCSEEQAHLFTRGLTLAHLDATLRGREDAREFLAGDVASELAARGVDAIVRRE